MFIEQEDRYGGYQQLVPRIMNDIRNLMTQEKVKQMNQAEIIKKL